MPDRIYVGFGPHGGEMAAQAMETGKLEKKQKLDEEAKDRVAKASMLVTALVMQGGEKGINPILNIQNGEPTGDPKLDKMFPAVRQQLSELSAYEQSQALKTGNAVAATVGKQFIAEQKAQQTTLNQTMDIAGKYNLPIPVPGQTTTPGQMPQFFSRMSGILGNLPPGVLGSQIQPENPLGQGVMTGDVGAPQLMINPPPQKPGAQKFVRDVTGKYVPVKEGVQGYPKPTAPKKVTKIKVYDTSTKQYTRVPEDQLDNQRYVLPENVPKVNYQSNLLIAAKIAGIDPKKVVSGEITQQEAEKLAKVYKDKFGAMNLLGAILSGGLPQSTIQYDAQGNRVQ